MNQAAYASFSWVYAARMMGIFHGALRAHGTGWAIGGCL